ncbi:MAG: hypothetical protein OXG04_07745 [Acidobacteria bacterium]|nr:hypothetical protein [Acidobacteriota bacterium]
MMQALTEFRRLARLLIVKDLPDRDVGWIAWQLRAIYREIPDLALTVEDVQETFDLDRDTCEIVMRALTDVGFLEPDGCSLRLAA